VQIKGGDSPYSEMRHDPDLVALYRNNAAAVGRKLIDAYPSTGSADLARAAASTDMANVSLRIPAIHPMIGIESLPAVNHQPEFAAHCITPAAHRALFDGAVALAWTALDAATTATVRDRLRRRAPAQSATD